MDRFASTPILFCCFLIRDLPVGSAFGVWVYVAVHDAFMLHAPYTNIRKGEVHELGQGLAEMLSQSSISPLVRNKREN